MSSAAIVPIFPTGLFDLLTIGLRLLEIAMATIIAGVNVANLRYPHPDRSSRVFKADTDYILSNLIYTEAVAGVATLLAVVLVLGFRAKYTWPIDFILFILWMVAFALLQDLRDGQYQKRMQDSYSLYVTDSSLITVLCILSSVAWLISGIVNIVRYVVTRRRAANNTPPVSAPVAETASISGV